MVINSDYQYTSYRLKMFEIKINETHPNRSIMKSKNNKKKRINLISLRI